jgi:hypothetical protein
MVMSGNGLRPPVASSVDPIGIPTRPTVEREAIVGEDADPVGLDEAVALAQVPEAVPEMPAPSKSGVGAEVPETPPVAGDSPLIVEPLPMVELPAEHAVVVVVAVVIEPGDELLEADGLTPGVASSVAPSGIPVAVTGAPGPIPSGEVMPIGATMPVLTALWAKAVLNPKADKTNTTITARLIGASQI